MSIESTSGQELPEDEPVAVTSTPVPTLAVPELPPRPVWATVQPSVPWCPDGLAVHLEAVVPGLAASGTSAAVAEATGAIVTMGTWSLLLATRRGRLHAHRGDHREDAGHLATFADGWCAAVADGAGSASYSRIGAAIATATVVRALRDALDTNEPSRASLDSALRTGAQAANAAMRDFAERAGLALRDLRTTLLVVAMHGDQLGVMQVGDGAIALFQADGSVNHPHAAATGDYSGEVAHFLPDDGALEQLQQSIALRDASDLTGVLLASDGVDDPWYPFTRHAGPLYTQLLHGMPEDAAVPTGYVPAWREPVVGAPDALAALCAWLAFEKRGENDDRTLCVVHRVGQSGATSWR